MNKELMHKTLVKLGFTDTEAQVYSYLENEGPQKARDIAETLKLNKQQLYLTLTKLKNKGTINVSFDYPVRFLAVPFEKVLDHLVKAKMEQQEALQKSKEDLLATWRSITKKDSSEK